MTRQPAGKQERGQGGGGEEDNSGWRGGGEATGIITTTMIMMMTMCRALRLVEEKRHQRCCRPMGGKDNKDDARPCTPSRAEAEGHTVGEEEDCKDVSRSRRWWMNEGEEEE